MTERIKQRIEALMVARGFTRTGLATAAGLSKGTIREMMEPDRGRASGINTKKLERIADALGVDVSYLTSDFVDLSADEAELLNALRSLPSDDVRWLRQTVERLKAASPGPGPKRDPES